MKYFLDTEFIEDGKTIDLISIGIVDEQGREFYCIRSGFNDGKANQWVNDNVISKLESDLPRYTSDQIKDRLFVFLAGDKEPEFWGYYADYDWVVFCQLFGTMMDLPKGFPMYCRDIKQLMDSTPGVEIPKQAEGEHNALADARWNKKAYERLRVMVTK